MARQVCQALCYVHDNNIVHRDIKLDNILLQTSGVLDENTIVKITDFGLATRINPENKNQPGFKDFWGTMVFMAPEII